MLFCLLGSDGQPHTNTDSKENKLNMVFFFFYQRERGTYTYTDTDRRQRFGKESKSSVVRKVDESVLAEKKETNMESKADESDRRKEEKTNTWKHKEIKKGYNFQVIIKGCWKWIVKNK